MRLVTMSSLTKGAIGVERLRQFYKEQPRLILVGVLGLYIILASIVTFPFVLHPGSTLTAPWTGDVAGSVAQYEALKGGHLDPFKALRLPWISFPDGPRNNIGVNRVSFLSVLYLWIGSDTIGTIPAHSLLTFIGYVLTAFVTFLFVKVITRSSLAGVLAGFACAFSPTMYSLANSDMTYTHLWLFILPLWAFWHLMTVGYSRDRMALAAISVVPAMFWTPYYMLQGLVVGTACLLVTAFYLGKRNGWRQGLITLSVVGTSWVVLLASWAYLGLHTHSSIIPTRSLAEIYQQSANPLMYLLPGQFSWGPHGNSLLLRLLPSAIHTNLYLGLSVLALAVAAVIQLRSKERSKDVAHEDSKKSATILTVAAAVASFLFSLAPTVRMGPVAFPTPNYLVAHTVPALRAGQRFVMPLTVCLAVLAGIGAWQILRRLPSNLRLGSAILMLVVAGFDLWALPPQYATPVPTYRSLVALRPLPSAPVAQFDNGSLVDEHLSCLFQHEYNKPLINDCALGRSRDLGSILVLPLCDQVTALGAIGTRYIIVSPRDNRVLACLDNLRATTQTVAKDDAYEVMVLRNLDQSTTAAVRARFNLP